MKDLRMTIDELIKAIDHLLQAKKLVEKCRESVDKGLFIGNIIEDQVVVLF